MSEQVIVPQPPAFHLRQPTRPSHPSIQNSITVPHARQWGQPAESATPSMQAIAQTPVPTSPITTYQEPVESSPETPTGVTAPATIKVPTPPSHTVGEDIRDDEWEAGWSGEPSPKVQEAQLAAGVVDHVGGMTEAQIKEATEDPAVWDRDATVQTWRNQIQTQEPSSPAQNVDEIAAETTPPLSPDLPARSSSAQPEIPPLTAYYSPSPEATPTPVSTNLPTPTGAVLISPRATSNPTETVNTVNATPTRASRARVPTILSVHVQTENGSVPYEMPEEDRVPSSLDESEGFRTRRGRGPYWKTPPSVLYSPVWADRRLLIQ